ncbi:MAG: hypothetical protein EOO68_31980, partial [Moraxellaceae bacterium]
MKANDIKSLISQTFKEWNDDKASRLAAALAYYTVISLPALVILIIDLAGTILGEESARGHVALQLQSLLGQKGAESVQAMIASASNADTKSSWASMLSAATLVFGATGVVIQLQDALNTIWDVKTKPGNFVKSFILNRILSFGMILGIGFLLLVSLVISAGLAAFSDHLGKLVPGLEFVWPAIDFSVSVIDES